jgi:ComF family protein
MLSDFLSLLFPRLCIVCSQHLMKGEAEICLQCRFAIPKTDYHLVKDNEMERRFWGKVPIKQGMAYLKFHKGGKTQQLLYKIKYKGRKEAAELLGEWYGKELLSMNICADLIVPVPLHKNKFRKRGYNQSEYFAKGLSRSLNVKYVNVLECFQERTSQTSKTRMERWRNVEGVYSTSKPDLVKGAHVLLVDDVVTTGATMEVCAQSLLDSGALEVSIASIACAQ